MSRRPPLAFIFAVTLTGILNNTLLSPAIPDILDEFGVPDEEAGWLVSLGSVAGIVIAPVVGILADRYGRRVVLSVCLAIFGIAGGSAALAPSFGFLLGARFIQGFGSAGLVNLAVVLIGDHWTGADRTRLVGRNAAVLTIGLAALPLLSGTVTQAAGWRVTFIIYTVALAMSGIAWIVLDSWRHPDPPQLRDQIEGVRDVVVRPEIRVLLLGAFLVFVMIFGLFLTVFPVHLAEHYGMEAGARGVMIAVPAIGSTVVAFNLGRIRALLSTRSLVILSGLGFTVAFVTIGLATTVFMVAMAAVIYGASEGAMIPGLQDQAMEGSPGEHRGGVMAVWVSMSRTGQTVGPILAGAGLALWSTGTVMIIGASVAVLIVMLGLFGSLSRSRVELDSVG